MIQRVQALNLFLADVYGPQKILREKPVLRDLVQSSTGHLPRVDGIKPPLGVYVHVAGIDLVRRPDGAFVVLEDNLRVPSGVSYVIENRRVMKRALAGVFHRAGVRPVSDYPVRLREVLASFPGGDGEGAIVVLTPGPYNSAYFEHSFLARRMGVQLVEGRDLFVKRKRVYLKTTEGPRPVTVIYRRIDDEFIDPETFRPDSMLGIPGLVEAYRAGNVTLANAIGNGVADDKAVYAAVPEIIRFYLAEEPILPQVPTFLCRKDEDRSYVLSHLTEMVVKEVSGLGRLRHAGGAQGEPRRGRPHARSDPEQAARLHRAAGGRALLLPGVGGQAAGAAPRRPAALRHHRLEHLGASRRAHPRRAARGIVRRQLEPGRRIEGHLGAASVVGGRRARERRRRARGRHLRSSS